MKLRLSSKNCPSYYSSKSIDAMTRSRADNIKQEIGPNKNEPNVKKTCFFGGFKTAA